MEKIKKLTPRDLAFGIGCKATDEELRELVSRLTKGNRKDGMVALEEIKKRLGSSI